MSIFSSSVNMFSLGIHFCSDYDVFTMGKVVVF